VPADLALPYVRLRIDYAQGYQVLAPRLFTSYLEGKVANSGEAVIFFKSAVKGSGQT
jgi:hypothetical protein